jgi:hypothetical protein
VTLAVRRRRLGGTLAQEKVAHTPPTWRKCINSKVVMPRGVCATCIEKVAYTPLLMHTRALGRH